MHTRGNKLTSKLAHLFNKGYFIMKLINSLIYFYRWIIRKTRAFITFISPILTIFEKSTATGYCPMIM
ncbi:hypothetical protein FH42_08645 [Klebsiella pneumoniae]|nr:hypothetical protein FH42_08645 [Klebsiella pneumoniae]